MNLISKADFLQAFHRRIAAPAAVFELDPEGGVLVPYTLWPVNLIEAVTSPFSQSGLVLDPHQKEWVYVDDSQQLQGPFSTLEMDGWYNQGLLHHEILVGLNSRERLLTLASFIEVGLKLSELTAQNKPN